jgi:hypothetical protein
LSNSSFRYILRQVNSHCGLSVKGIFLVLWFCGIIPAQSQPKEIRLRNEHIRTERPQRAGSPPRSQILAHRTTGLFLIQFVERFDPAWRQELQARGVDLLQYVPDDAFVARLKEADLDDIRALPFVQWLGDYRPDHKVDGLLQGGARGQNGDALHVTVLLSASATGEELANARGSLEEVQQESRYRFGLVWRGKLNPGRLWRLAESPAVLWIEETPRMKLSDEISSKAVGGGGTNHGAHQYTFDGRGTRIAIADTGLHEGTADGMHPDLAGRVTDFFHYGSPADAADQHSHGTHLAGIIAGNGALQTADGSGFWYGLGVAPGASIIAQRIFDGAGQYTLSDSFETLTRQAVQAGAHIGNNSWGADTQGRYDVSAAEFDALVRDADATSPGDQPYTLVFSAGNAGPGAQTIASPAAAKNVIAVGASQSSRSEFLTHMEGQDAMANFSSRGPSEDGRIKPDVVAPGTWTASLRSPMGDPANAGLLIDEDYLYMSGTSQAAAHASGAAAVFAQYYRERYAATSVSPALVKAALIHSAVDMNNLSGTGSTPNMNEGWGRVDLAQVLDHQGAHDFQDQISLLTNGQTYVQSVIIASSNQPLSITMVYTDVPGFPAAIPALVNDLDLEVTAPDGRIYRGNQFENGASVADAPASDNLNNVERIYLKAPKPGEYLIRIRAVNVVSDARRDTPAIDQDFALIWSGELPDPEAGVVLIDRSRYTAPSRINIRLLDYDFSTEPNALVTVRSATEPNGTVVLLSPATSTGILTGAVATARAPAATGDGIVQIADGDWISVEFWDDSHDTLRFAAAVADLVPPLISGVEVTNRFGRTIASWITDEPANSIIRFNTNTTLLRRATNNILQTLHEVELTDLAANLTYFYSVSSTDAAGNTATNPGPLRSFTATPGTTVLLVDAYLPAAGDNPIPLDSYTSALDQTGASYEVWSLTQRGQLPLLDNIRAYPIVMWRINDSLYRPDSDIIPPAQQAVIQEYVNGGGAFFMASMSILSRILDRGGGLFVTNVLHIQSFVRADPDNEWEYCTNCDENFRVPQALGVESDVIGDGIQTTLDYSSYPIHPFTELGPDFADTFGPATNASPFLVESMSGKACGLRFPRTGEDSTGRVVFVSFPLDAIPETGTGPNSRATFLHRALQFLSPGLNGVGTVAFGRSSYKLPDLLTIEVADADLAGLPGITVEVSSTSAGPITVSLRETTRRGLFRGFLPLVGATTNTAPVHLLASHGDTLAVEYYDASRQVVVQSSALVDAESPLISNVTVVSQFQDAKIRWISSERTDALVQFGESSFLGRTAYVADFETNHEVQLTGLIPDRTYFYKLVSRDAAGNTTVGEGDPHYFFHTRTPLMPPFIDLLPGTDATNWSVVNGSGTQFQWRLGQINNGFVAFPNAWASNPSGGLAKFIDTWLISPAINLTGGNVATLKFKQAYDFSTSMLFDSLNQGQLFIVTNSVNAPMQLAQYVGTTPSSQVWQDEEIDLTPHIGQVIFLAWRHHLKSIRMVNRPGWAIDDISITVSNLPPCTIDITNNLAQATVSVTGRANRIGRGYSTVFNGLPPGRYVVTWSAVPYYQTPQAQTNVLEENGLLMLEGLYTFSDLNSNGISDAWETAFFGNVSPLRTSLTDSDNDGSTDYAEFMAGTNPNLAGSRLYLLTPMLLANTNKPLLFRWPAVPGRIYQLQGTYDLSTWTPTHDSWLQATTGTLSTNVSLPDLFEPYIFRLEVRP